MLNKTIMQGRFTKALDIRYTQNEIAVISFTIAWNKKIGEKETSCFLNCVAYRQTAEFIAKYFNKGDQAIVEGELTTRSYDDKEGNKKYVTELIVDKVHFCGSKKDQGETHTYTTDDGDLPF